MTITSWWNLSSVNKRWSSSTAKLSEATRTFCYTFVLGMILAKSSSGTTPFKLGTVTIDDTFIGRVTILVAIFVFFDLMQYSVEVLIIGYAQTDLKNKSLYHGQINQRHDPNVDESEHIVAQNSLVRFTLSGVKMIFYIKAFIAIALALMTIWQVIP